MDIYRSLLFISSSSMQMLDKVDILKPDGFMLDLEDSVPEDNKNIARENIKSRLKTIGNKSDIFIRINSLDTKYFTEDIKETINPNMLGFIVPNFEDFDTWR